MNDIRERILKTGKNLHAGVTDLSTADVEMFENSLRAKFGYGETDIPLWHFIRGKSILSDDAWTWIHDFLKHQNDVRLFFLPRREPTIFHVERGEKIVPLLRFSSYCSYPNHEFYVSNAAADYMIYFDHEHALCTVGTASNWLEELTTYVHKLVDLPPQTLYVSDVRTMSFGNEIVVDCLSSLDADAQAFRLTFENCGGIKWATFSGKSLQAEVQHILIGENLASNHYHKQRANIRTRRFELAFVFNELHVQKDADS